MSRSRINFLVQKCLCLGPKNVCAENNFDSKKILGLKRFWVQKELGSKKFGCQTILGPKKTFGSKKFWVQKLLRYVKDGLKLKSVTARILLIWTNVTRTNVGWANCNVKSKWVIGFMIRGLPVADLEKVCYPILHYRHKHQYEYSTVAFRIF